MSDSSFANSNAAFYRYLTIGVLSGVMVGISLAVSIYHTRNQIELPIIRIGLGITAGLAIAASTSAREIGIVESTIGFPENTSLDSRILGIGSTNPQFIAGLAPIIGMGITLFPFVLQDTILSQFTAVVGVVVTGIAVLFIFGGWLGTVTRQRWYIVGARIAIFGPFVAWANLVLA